MTLKMTDVGYEGTYGQHKIRASTILDVYRRLLLSLK